MKHTDVARFALDDLLYDLYGQELDLSQKELRHQLERKFNKLCSCGHIINVNGNLIKVRCSNASCQRCGNKFAKAQAAKMYKACGSDNHDDYMMVTCIIGLSDNINDMFPTFDRFRKKVRTAIKRRREGKKSIALEYQKVAIAGTLEIDMFDMKRFDELGNDKKEQYMEHFGFKLDTLQDNIWVCTFHGVVHVSTLNEDTIISIFRKASPYVHLDKLHRDKPVWESLENIVGYSAKVGFSTTYSNLQKYSWYLEDIKKYTEYTSLFSRGRMAMKFFLGPPKEKRAKI